MTEFYDFFYSSNIYFGKIAFIIYNIKNVGTSVAVSECIYISITFHEMWSQLCVVPTTQWIDEHVFRLLSPGIKP